LNNRDLLKLIETAQIIGCTHFNQFAENIYSDEEFKMIHFMNEPGMTRKINDWGRDEDTDISIGLSRNGWIRYTHICEIGVGNKKLIETDSTCISTNEVLSLLEKSTIKEYLNFIEKCIVLKNEYRLEFDRAIY
jgi:hypothetical protein